MLTKDQKLDILRSRVNVIEGVLYNLELSVIEEESKSQPSQQHLSELEILRSDNLLALDAINSRLEIVLSE